MNLNNHNNFQLALFLLSLLSCSSSQPPPNEFCCVVVCVQKEESGADASHPSRRGGRGGRVKREEDGDGEQHVRHEPAPADDDADRSTGKRTRGGGGGGNAAGGGGMGKVKTEGGKVVVKKAKAEEEEHAHHHHAGGAAGGGGASASSFNPSCPSCSSPFSPTPGSIHTPKLLPCCSHSICHQCLQQHILASSSASSPTCPSCHASLPPLTDIPDDLRLMLTIANALLAERAAPPITTATCRRHPTTNLDRFCKDCSDLICPQCAAPPHLHASHTHISIHQAAESHRPQLEDMAERVLAAAIQELVTLLDHIRLLRSSSLPAHRQHMHEQVTAHIAALHAEVDKLSSDLHARIDQACAERDTRLSGDEDGVEQAIAAANATVRDIRYALESGNDGVVVGMKQGAEKEVEGVLQSSKLWCSAESSKTRDGWKMEMEMVRDVDEVKAAIHGSARVVVRDGGGMDVSKVRMDRVLAKDLAAPLGMAVDRHGNVFIVEWNAHRVKVVSREGEVVRTFGSKGKRTGQLHGPVDVAIDEATGHIYVSDSRNHRVVVFTAHGNFVRNIPSPGRSPRGIEITSDGMLFLACFHSDSIHRMQLDGSPPTSGPSIFTAGITQPFGIGVDSRRNRLYATQSSSNVLFVYDITTGACLRKFSTPLSKCLDGVAVHPVTGQIVVGDNLIRDNKVVVVFDPEAGSSVVVEGVSGGL